MLRKMISFVVFVESITYIKYKTWPIRAKSNLDHNIAKINMCATIFVVAYISISQSSLN
jgi:hypothetical protein